MKKKLYAAVGFLFLLAPLIAFQNFSVAPTAASDNRIKYIGFYATAYNSNNILAAKSYGNLVHIDHNTADVNFIISALRSAASYNKKAALSIQHVFYDCSVACILYPTATYTARWQNLWNAIKQNNLQNTIYSFYIDEPELHARSAQQRFGIVINVVTELETIARLIKSSQPTALLQMTSAWLDVSSTMRLPTNFDVFGIDCYNGWDRCGDALSGKSIPEYYSILNSKLNALEQADGKRRYMFLYAPTFYAINPPAWTYPTEAQALSLFPKYVAFAKTNNRIVGIVGFLWTNLTENNTSLYGAVGHARFKELMRKEYIEILEPTPRILQGGRGCTDGLCLWVRADYLATSREFRIRDPQNYSVEMVLTISHGLLQKATIGGATDISFRIPAEAMPIYQNRGLDVVIINKYTSGNKANGYRFPKP